MLYGATTTTTNKGNCAADRLCRKKIMSRAAMKGSKIASFYWTLPYCILLFCCTVARAGAFVSTKQSTSLAHSFSYITRQSPRQCALSAATIIPPPDTSVVNSIPTQSTVEKEVDRFENDVKTVLKSLRPEERDPSIKGIFRLRKLSFTNIYTKAMWDQHTSRWRYVRHLRTWPTSRLLLRILPQWLTLVAWSFGSRILIDRPDQRFSVPLTPLSLLSTFVAALLTLRSNQGLDRLYEARLAVGKMVYLTRDFAHLLAAYVLPKDPVLGLMMARHVSIFGWSLKGHLRESDESDIMRTMLSPADANFLLRQRKLPVAVTARLRQALADLSSRDLMKVPQHNAMEKTLGDLHNVIMICERIQASAIPSVYTAHTSRLLMVYLFFLPLALHGSGGAVFVSSLVGFAMLGLDEISHFLEEPFRLMPIYQLSKTSMLDVADAVVCQPGPLPTSFEQEDPSGKVIAKKADYW